MEEMKTNVQEKDQQKQNDNTPKWLKWTAIIFAVGSCSAIVASALGLFGDAPGQCIKNRNYTKNYQKRVDIDFNDFVRRDQYIRNRRKNG